LEEGEPEEWWRKGSRPWMQNSSYLGNWVYSMNILVHFQSCFDNSYD
jgi:hypothetical protein